MVEPAQLIQNEDEVVINRPDTNRTARLLQLPRRLLFLVVAFLVVRVLLLGIISRFEALGITRTALGRPAINQEIFLTVVLWLAVMVMATILAVVPVVLGILVHRLEKRNGWPGFLLKGAGRVIFFGLATIPILVLALILLYYSTVALLNPDILNRSESISSSNLLMGLLAILLIPFIVAWLPALLTAQSTTRIATLNSTYSPIRRIVGVIFSGLGVAWAQTGGILSGIFVVEIVFNLPGVGGLLLQGLQTSNADLVMASITALVGVVFAGRVLAECFNWLARLVLGEPPDDALPPSPIGVMARQIWVILSMTLWVTVMVLALAGLVVRDDQLFTQNLDNRNAAPSIEYPLGTDELGRNLLPRMFRGTTNTILPVLVAAVTGTILAVVPGVFSGVFQKRGGWHRETLSDLLILPFDILLLIPTIPLAVVLFALFSVSEGIQEAWPGILFNIGVQPGTLLLGMLFIPRTARAFRALWATGPLNRPARRRLLLSIVTLVLGLLYFNFLVVMVIDFTGFGVQEPVPSLGNVMRDVYIRFIITPWKYVVPVITMAFIGFVFYLAADAIAGYFFTKKTIAHLNE